MWPDFLVELVYKMDQPKTIMTIPNMQTLCSLELVTLDPSTPPNVPPLRAFWSLLDGNLGCWFQGLCLRGLWAPRHTQGSKDSHVFRFFGPKDHIQHTPTAFQTPQVPSERDQTALNSGTLGGLGLCRALGLF